MRLDRIEAVRFGALSGFVLAGLGDGLNVVLGPNETGKSTLTALVRHVLYGFPGKTRRTERLYIPASGERHGRLAFVDDEGEWVVERVEGRKEAGVTAVRGPESPLLLQELVGNLPEHDYRMLFGFGLDDLAGIDDGEESIVGRIYAAQTGLKVSALDVREALRKQADEIFRPRGQKQKANTLAREAEEARRAVAELEAQAESFVGDQQRLAGIEERLAPLQALSLEAEARSRGLDADVRRLAEAAEGESSLSEEALRRAEETRRAEAALAAVTIDERVLAVDADLDAALEGLSGFRVVVGSLREAESEIAKLDARAALIDVPSDADASPRTRAEFERWKDDLAKAEYALDQAEAVTAAAPAASSALPAIATAVVGLAALAVALPLRQNAAALVGAVVFVLGIALYALARSTRGASAVTSPHAAERRRALEDLRERWRAWLAEGGLDGQGDEPAAVAAVLAALSDRDALSAKRAELAAQADRERERAAAWVARLHATASAFLAAGPVPPLDEAEALASRARQALDLARKARDDRDRLARDLEAARAAEAEVARRLAALRESSAALLAERGLEGRQPEALEALAEQARRDFAEAREEHAALKSERDELKGRLGVAGGDEALAEARQRLETAREKARRAGEEYVRLALAERLLGLAQSRYEKERQPEIMRAASVVMGRMNGRYTSVRKPMDASEVAAVREDGQVRTAAELSTGAAQQLYLALRIAIIQGHGDTGRHLPVLMDDVVVNFDPERRRCAAEAVAELAATRQVVFFTCHPETAAVLAEAVPGRTEVRLDARC